MAAFACLSGGPKTAWAEAPRACVVCGSYALAALIGSLLGDEIETRVMDGTPNAEVATVDAVQDCRLFVYYPRQAFMRRQVEAAGFRSLEWLLVRREAQLMLPSEFYQAARELLPPLSRIFPYYQSYMEERLVELKEQARSAENEILAHARDQKLMGLPCIVSQTLAPFAKWLGFKVIGQFQDEGGLTPERLKRIDTEIRGSGVWLVLGTRTEPGRIAAQTVASRIGGEAILLSPDPLRATRDDWPDWRRLLNENWRTVREAIAWHSPAENEKKF